MLPDLSLGAEVDEGLRAARALQRVDHDKLRAAALLILEAIGEDPTRPGLLDTPRRFAGMWAELVEEQPFNETRFADGSDPDADSLDQMVVVDQVPIYSVCEHHLAAFWGQVTMAYIPRQYHLGLSKFARIARRVALGVQVQERLAQRIATALTRVTESPDVAVVVRGQHTCMLMRGAKSEHRMTSSVMLGAFRREPEARAEFFALSGR